MALGAISEAILTDHECWRGVSVDTKVWIFEYRKKLKTMCGCADVRRRSVQRNICEYLVMH